MAIMAKLSINPNLFSSLPSKPPDNRNFSTPSTPIPIPKYPPPLRRSRIPAKPAPPENPAFKIPHRKTKYFKPVKQGDAFSPDGSDRAVVIGDSGVSYLLPGAPFEFQFSYSETPKEKPLAIREPAFLPFAPPTMPRPWTGKAPLKGKDEKQRKKIPLFDSFNPPPPGKKGVKCVEMPGPFPAGKYPKEGKSREEVLGEPLKKWEIQMMIKPYLNDNRQVNLGRDGLTHNMLELVHTHWKRRRVCKVRCRGIPTVDMKNICYHLEEKTGGKVIHRAGGVVYLFRGRNYNYRSRPQYPVMLWKPAAPVYPKLIQKAPEGLTEGEADELRIKGKKLLPIRKLAKNGIYLTLVKDVRNAFEGSQLAKIDCTGLDPSDYKKLGAKLKELVPCVLLSFDDEQILMWRGRDWKSMYPEPLSPDIRVKGTTDYCSKPTNTTENAVISSPKMLSLWNRAIESSKALLLDKTKLNPDDVLKKVEEFERVAQAAEHTYPALILSRGSDGDYDSDDDVYDSDPFEETDFSPAEGELPIDRLVSKFSMVDEDVN